MNIYMLPIIKEIRETRGSNAKIELLRLYDCDLLRKVMFYTYNPFYKYNLRKIPRYTNKFSHIYTLENEGFQLLDDLRNRIYTGNAAIDKLVDLLSNMNEDDAKLMEHIIERNLKFGLNVRSINKAYPKLIPVFEVMLADAKVPVDKLLENNEFLYVQKKMDGKRCIIVTTKDDVTFYSRSGKEMENLERHEMLINSLLTVRHTYLDYDFVLDGELIMKEDDGTEVDRKISNGAINRKNLTQELIDKFHFVAWDILSFDEFFDGGSTTPYEERYYILMFVFLENFKHIEVVETFTASTEKEINRITNDYISEGFEGSVVKTPHHHYVKKRSSDWVKFKAILEADLKVVGFNYGAPGSKYETMLGALQCESSDGKIKVDVGTGFTDQMREDITEENIIGKIVTIQYNELITNSLGNTSMFLPVYIETRDDKTEADDYEKIKRNG